MLQSQKEESLKSKFVGTLKCHVCLSVYQKKRMSSSSNLTPIKKKKSLPFAKFAFADAIYPKLEALLGSLKKGKILDSDRRLLKSNVKQIYLNITQIDQILASTIWDEQITKITEDTIKTWESTKQNIISFSTIHIY